MINTTFPGRIYLLLRQEVEIAKLSDPSVWRSAAGEVYGYLKENGIAPSGPMTAVYFTWDTTKGMTGLGIGVPVEGMTQIGEVRLSLVMVEASSAVQLIVKGDYSLIKSAHDELQQYMDGKMIAPTLVIEEYLITGMDAPDSKEWETRISYLHA